MAFRIEGVEGSRTNEGGWFLGGRWLHREGTESPCRNRRQVL